MRSVRFSSFLLPIRRRYLLLVVIILGLIFFALTYLGIHKARQSLLKIMVDEGRALVESLALSSNNAIQAGLLLESLAEEKFIDIAHAAENRLADVDEPERFRRFGEEHNLLSIDFLDSDLSVRGSDRYARGFVPVYPDEVAADLFDLKETGGSYRSVLVSSQDSLVPLIQYFIYALSPDDDFLVMATEALYLDQIMQEIGIGYLIRKISDQAGIEYILLQSREGIVFSSQPLSPILKIESDPFLDALMETDTVGWRIHVLEQSEVLEIARRFESVSYPVGLYRIGMNLNEFHEISRGYDRQIIIIAVILFLLTLLVVAVVSVNQNYFILDRTFRQMRSMTETIFDRLSSAVLAYDNNGKIIAVNHALKQLTGLDTDCIGFPVVDISEKLQFDLPDAPKPGERLLSFEKRITAPSGDRKTILLGMSSLPEEAGGGAVILIHDISDQKRLEEENRRRERLSEMGDMAAGVAHEIRNPLNAIGIAAQRLKMEFEPGEDSEEFNSLAKNILDETARLNEILTRFLDLAKTRAAEDRPIDLLEPINKGIASLSFEANTNKVKIKYSSHDEIRIRGTVEKLQQVFINLLKNSIQAMPDGGEITIDVDTSAAGNVIITVADNGRGFPTEVMSKIFQPYFTTKVDGSGLGLALAYKTVTDYGGTIEASNNPTGGARLRITLPRA
jgi:PAS domain S-box-containing protein